MKAVNAKMETTAKVPCFPSCRATLCLVGFSGGLIFFLMRSNISVAVVCMTTPEYVDLSEWPGVNWNGWFNWTEKETTCAKRPTKRGNSELQGLYAMYQTKKCSQSKSKSRLPYGRWIEPEFDWSRDIKGIILSAFSYGYISTQFIAGVVAKKLGPKKVIVFGYSLVILATLLSPKGAEWNPYALAALQVVKGMCGGVFFPCFWTLWGKWAPPLERTTLVGLMMAGNSLGNILAFIVLGYLCDYVNWESVFYVYGVIGIFWVATFMYFVYEEPDSHPRISEEESSYLQRTIIKTKHIMPLCITLKEVPLRSIVTSVAVWSIALSEISFGYGYYMMITEIPQYLVDVMHTDISENGFYTALPHICNFAICFVAPLCSDWMIRNGVKKAYVRKLMQSIALFPAGGMMIGIGYLDSTELSIVLVCLGLYGLTATYRSGSITNQVEIGPKYAGIISGIVNTLASLPGTFAPFVTGVIVESGTREEWQVAFLIAGIFNIVGGIIYLLFAKGEVQPWALEQAHHNLNVSAEKKSLLRHNDDNANCHVDNYGSIIEEKPPSS